MLLPNGPAVSLDARRRDVFIAMIREGCDCGAIAGILHDAVLNVVSCQEAA